MYIYILVAWQGHRGDKKKKILLKILHKAAKPKLDCQDTDISKCMFFFAIFECNQ